MGEPESTAAAVGLGPLTETGPQPAESDELLLGGDEASRAVNAGLRSLARAARSFLLYDPGNEAIAVFLAQYRADLSRGVALASQVTGSLGLQVRPFELVWNGEVVYLERDRERSLAFRMFRDGVRRLTIQPEVEWEELLRLLQVLSVRFTGVRQQEEDIVTLLWKAGFRHIELVAVEGFEAEEPDPLTEEEGERAGGGTGAAAHHVDAPADFDLPLPSLLAPAALARVELRPEELDALHLEASSRGLPEQCLRLADELLVMVRDPTDPCAWEEVRPTLEELRDFLLSDGQLQGLLELLKATLRLQAAGHRQAGELLQGFIDARALARILHSLPAHAVAIPDELLWMVDHLPGDHLSHALDVLARERGTAARRVCRQLVEHLIRSNPEAVLRRIAEDRAEVAADLLRATAHALPDRALEALDLAIGRGEPDLAFEGLRVLEGLQWQPELRQRVIKLLDASADEVRLRALAMVGERGGAAAFDSLVEVLERRSHGEMTAAEAHAYGLTLVKVEPTRARALLEEWIRPASFWKRLLSGPAGNRWMQWAAVSGLCALPGAEVEEPVRWLAERAGAELAEHCSRSLARHRRELRHV